MMECKSALKPRWTADEVAMLVEEWAKVCASPKAKTLKSDELNTAIFNRYNSRCARMRQLRRSPSAIFTQRDRMVRFARFVSNFNLSEQAEGRRVWFDLSHQEQLEIDIPSKWRRQDTTFTQDVWNTFKCFILPVENGSGKRKNAKKRGTKLKKVSSRSSGKQQQVLTRVDHQPCWTSQENVLLAHRWGKLMKIEELTLEAFYEMTYDKSCECLASPTRPSFSAWRKSRTLVSSWRFISSFNAQHHPGWFALAETERDRQIKWEELPDNFEDLDREVFVAIDEAVSKNTMRLNVSGSLPDPPSPTSISPLYQAPSGSTPLLRNLCPKEGKAGQVTTDDTLDRLLLDDDGADNMATNSELQQPHTCEIESLVSNDFVSDACILVTETTPGAPIIKQDDVPSPLLESAPTSATDSTVQELTSTLQTHKCKIQKDLCQLKATLDLEYKQVRASIRTFQAPTRLASQNT